MRDPFRSNSNAQLIREAQIGLSLVGILLVLFVYVAFYRISNRGAIPEHIRNAAMATRLNNDTEEQRFSPAPAVSNSFVADTSGRQVSSQVAQSSYEANLPPVQRGTEPTSNDLSENRKFLRSESEFRRPDSGNANEAERSETTDQRNQLTLPEFADQVESNLNQLNQVTSKLKQMTPDQLDPSSNGAPQSAGIIQAADFSKRDTDRTPTNSTTKSRSKVVDDPFEFRPSSNALSRSSESLPPSVTPSTDPAVTESVETLLPKTDLTDFAPLGTPPGTSPVKPTITGAKPSGNQFAASQRPGTRLDQPIHVNELRAPIAEADPSFHPESLHPISKAEAEQESKSVNFENEFQPAAQSSQLDSTGDFKPTELSADVVVSTANRGIEAEKIPVPEIDSATSPADGLTENLTSKNTFGDQVTRENRAGLSHPSPQQPRYSLAAPGQTNRPEANQETYQIRPGDSFWSISECCYGDGRFFRALFKCNESVTKDFENLVPGTMIKTPNAQELRMAWPDLCPSREEGSESLADWERSGRARSGAGTTYCTREGDTLFEIARQRLGQASRYLEIQKTNQSVLPTGVHHLTPLPAGIQLNLPIQ